MLDMAQASEVKNPPLHRPQNYIQVRPAHAFYMSTHGVVPCNDHKLLAARASLKLKETASTSYIQPWPNLTRCSARVFWRSSVIDRVQKLKYVRYTEYHYVLSPYNANAAPFNEFIRTLQLLSPDSGLKDATVVW